VSCLACLGSLAPDDVFWSVCASVCVCVCVCVCSGEDSVFPPTLPHPAVNRLSAVNCQNNQRPHLGTRGCSLMALLIQAAREGRRAACQSNKLGSLSCHGRRRRRCIKVSLCSFANWHTESPKVWRLFSLARFLEMCIVVVVWPRRWCLLAKHRHGNPVVRGRSGAWPFSH